MRSIKPPFNLHRILENQFGFRNISLDKLLLSLFYRLPKGILGWVSDAERIEWAERNLQKGALRSEGNMIATLPARAPLRSHALHHNTPTYWWRGDSDEANQCMGMIRRPWWSEANGQFGQDAGVTPYSFSKDILGFLMTTESQDLGLTTHPKDGVCWQYSDPITILGC